MIWEDVINGHTSATPSITSTMRLSKAIHYEVCQILSHRTLDFTISSGYHSIDLEIQCSGIEHCSSIMFGSYRSYLSSIANDVKRLRRLQCIKRIPIQRFKAVTINIATVSLTSPKPNLRSHPSRYEGLERLWQCFHLLLSLLARQQLVTNAQEQFYNMSRPWSIRDGRPTCRFQLESFQEHWSNWRLVWKMPDEYGRKSLGCAVPSFELYVVSSEGPRWLNERDRRSSHDVERSKRKTSRGDVTRQGSRRMQLGGGATIENAILLE